jgi:hypothetical protein
MDCSIKSARVGRSQWNNRVEVGDVPTFLQHVHVNHDLGRLLRAFDSQ